MTVKYVKHENEMLFSDIRASEISMWNDLSYEMLKESSKVHFYTFTFLDLQSRRYIYEKK